MQRDALQDRLRDAEPDLGDEKDRESKIVAAHAERVFHELRQTVQDPEGSDTPCVEVGRLFEVAAARAGRRCGRTSALVRKILPWRPSSCASISRRRIAAACRGNRALSALAPAPSACGRGAQSFYKSHESSHDESHRLDVDVRSFANGAGSARLHG